MPIILIIDDYDLLRDVMKMALEDLGLVHTARSGEEVLGMLQLVPVDVVVTDMNMPGMSGIDVVRAIHTQKTGKQLNAVGNGRDRSLQYNPTIILYTAMMTRDLWEQARALGVAACLTKPFELEELRKIIERLLSTDYAD